MDLFELDMIKCLMKRNFRDENHGLLIFGDGAHLAREEQHDERPNHLSHSWRNSYLKSCPQILLKALCYKITPYIVKERLPMPSKR